MAAEEIRKLSDQVKNNKDEVAAMKSSWDEVKSKTDQIPTVVTGINDIKNLLTAFGEKLAALESRTSVHSDVLRDLILSTRAREYHSEVEAKLSRPATLVLARSNGTSAPEASADAVSAFIDEVFDDSRFVVEPMGKKGSFKVHVEALSPMESRRLCAAILSASKKGLKEKFALNAFYDNPLFLRGIRSEVLRFTATMLQEQGLKLRGKPVVKKDILVLDGVSLFPEYLVPSDETFWSPAFHTIGNLVRQHSHSFDPRGNITVRDPLALGLMEDLFVASKGLLFPNPPTRLAPSAVP